MAGEEKPVYPVEFFRIKLGGIEAAGLFQQATLPSGSLTPTDFKHTTDQAKPTSTKVAVQVSWTDISMIRGIDKDAQLWKWFAQGLPEEGGGGGAVERKDLTIEACDSKGAAVITWNIIGAFPTSYQASGLNAGSHEVGVESVTFAYHNANRV